MRQPFSLSPFSLSILVLISAPPIFLGSARSGDDKPLVLEKAQEAYTNAVKDADTKLLQKFEKSSDQVANRKLPPEQRIALIDALKVENKRFDDSGLVPWSEPMWHFLLPYLQSRQSAESKLRKSYNIEIDKAIKAKDDEKVKDLRAELKSKSGVKIIAKWKHNDGPQPIVFYSNGMINDEDGPGTWNIGPNSKLTLIWPNAQAPKGAWIDVCTVSPDGMIYAGVNQKGVKISGMYVDR